MRGILMQSARKLKARKPRNPLVAPALMRKAGQHRKSNKAQRAAANLAAKRGAVPGAQ